MADQRDLITQALIGNQQDPLKRALISNAVARAVPAMPQPTAPQAKPDLTYSDQAIGSPEAMALARQAQSAPTQWDLPKPLTAIDNIAKAQRDWTPDASRNKLPWMWRLDDLAKSPVGQAIAAPFQALAHGIKSGVEAPAEAYRGNIPQYDYDPVSGRMVPSKAGQDAAWDTTLMSATGGGMAVKAGERAAARIPEADSVVLSQRPPSMRPVTPELQSVRDQIERLNNSLPNSMEGRSDILRQISALRDKAETLGPTYGEQYKFDPQRQFDRVFPNHVTKEARNDVARDGRLSPFGVSDVADIPLPANDSFTSPFRPGQQLYSNASDKAGAVGLAMDEASRLARAKELGFDTETTYYRGTNSQWDTPRSSNDRHPLGSGVYMTPDASYAAEYGKNVMPIHVRGPIAVAEDVPNEAFTSWWDRFKKGEFKDEQAARWARDNGYSGIKSNRMNEVAVFDPVNVRASSAAFDPAMSGVNGYFLANASDKAGAAGMLQRELDRLGFYSGALEQAKKLPNSASGGQILATLRNAGVKQSEIDATGLGNWLQSQPGNVSRDDVTRFLTENRVGLNESSYGKVNIPEGVNSFAPFKDAGLNGPAKWSRYSLDPNNPSYRETVLSLPEIPKGVIERDARRARMTEQERALDLANNGGRLTNDALNFRSGHFPEPNIIGHTMSSVVKHEGKPTYLLDQIQSDWGRNSETGESETRRRLLN